MRRTNPIMLLFFLFAVVAVFGGVSALKGGLFLARHEGDLLHLLDILFRMQAGQAPHLDFQTPIGALAFLPMVVFLKLGFGAGISIIYGQILVALCLLPAVWWVGVSRFGNRGAMAFGLVVLVFALALVHGETMTANSISMHYNRWSWALTYIVVALVMLQPKSERSGMVDGLILGAAMSALVLMKVTYVVALVPPVLAALAFRRQAKAFFVALLTSIVVFGLVTWIAGPEFWVAYVGDLLQVSQSSVRAKPSETFINVLASPAYLGGTLLGLAGVILLRQSGALAGGLLLLLFLPAFFFITYQNWANDPQWLILLAIILFALRPERPGVNGFGWNLANALNMTAVAALTFAAPSFLNMVYSPFKHAAIDTATYTQVLPRDTRHDDLQTMDVRANQVTARTQVDGFEYTPVTNGSGADAAAPTILLGEALPDCKLETGMVAWFDAIGQDLDASGLTTGKSIFVADILSSNWLFADLQPLPNGAPWLYSGLPGIEAADFLLVPLCANIPASRKLVIEAIAARPDLSLQEARRTDLYILLELTSPG